MPTPTLVRERPLATDVTPDTRSSEPRSAGGGRAWPVVVMACGLAFLAAAATVVVRAGDGAGVAPAASVDPAAITLAARDVSVVVQEYAPGQQSGWHTHPGIHAVAVLEGVLTVYDGQCRPATFEPGRPYVGGQQVHLVSNESDAPVRMVVTYLSPTAPTAANGHVAPPAGCTTG